MDRKKLLRRLVVLIFCIFLLNSIAGRFYWYTSIWWFDMPMHFMGGLWVGLLGLYLFKLEKVTPRNIFYILLFVLVVGVGWEIFEAGIDKIITQNSFNTLDTLSDIFFDLSGGVCAMLYLWKKQEIKQ